MDCEGGGVARRAGLRGCRSRADNGEVTDAQRTPEYSVPDNIAWVDGADFGMAEELYLTVVPEGRSVLLKDTARLIWHVAADGSDDVVRDVAALVGLPASEVSGEVLAFLEDLTARGLLVGRGTPAPAASRYPAVAAAPAAAAPAARGGGRPRRGGGRA